MKEDAPRPSKLVFCDECGTKVGYQGKDGKLVIFGRHHGIHHETVYKGGLDNPAKSLYDSTSGQGKQ